MGYSGGGYGEGGMNVRLSKMEYDFLVKSIESVSAKIDAISEKISHMDNKTIKLEEWRKHLDSSKEKETTIINNLKVRVSALENFRWFLVGASVILSAMIGWIISFGNQLIGQ